MQEEKTMRIYLYRVGIGYDGISLEYHEVEATNMVEARDIAIRKFLHPDKGYDHVEVKRIKREK